MYSVDKHKLHCIEVYIHVIDIHEGIVEMYYFLLYFIAHLYMFENYQ